MRWVTALETDRRLTLSDERTCVTRGAVVEVVPLKWTGGGIYRVLHARLFETNLTDVLIRFAEADRHRLT